MPGCIIDLVRACQEICCTAAGTQYMPGDSGWRLSLALAIVPAIILTLGGIFLPETPNSLLERGHDARARAILVKIRGTENVNNEFDDIKIAAQIATQVCPFFFSPNLPRCSGMQ